MGKFTGPLSTRVQMLHPGNPELTSHGLLAVACNKMAHYYYQDSQGDSAKWSTNDPLSPFCLPYRVAAHILDYVPIRQLVRVCMLVSRSWYKFLHDTELWINIMKRADNYSCELKRITRDINWPKLCLYSVCEPNWIRSFNLEGQLCLDPYWKMSSTSWALFKTGHERIAWNQGGGDKWKIEDWIKRGNEQDENVLKENGGSCQNYVTSYSWCCREQVVEFSSVGLNNMIMDEVQPSIEVSEWFCARWDCASMFYIRVELLDMNREVVRFFERSEETERGLGGELGWRKVCHVFSDYGRGVRFLRFADAGKDAQFWAGHYGSKMAAARSHVIFD